MTRKLNICLISREYPPETSNGGIGTYTYHLAHSLAEEGHKVTIVSEATDKYQNYFDKKVEVYRFFDERVPIGGISRVANLLTGDFFSHWWHSRSVFIKIKNITKKKNFNIIECPLWGGECFTYEKDLNIPLVIRLQTPVFKLSEVLNQSSSWILEYIERISLQKATLIASISQSISKLIISKYKIDPKKIIYSPLGVPLLKVKKTNFKKNSYKLLYVSRLEKRKGTQEFIEALPKILKSNNKITVDIVGRDCNQAPKGLGYVDFFKQTVSTHYQSRVRFHGLVNDKRLQNFYRDCDIFILPSRYESFGLVYLEAMSYGKSVIGTRVGGIPEIIKDNYTGLLVDVNDSEQIASAVLKLFSNNNLREKIGHQAFKVVREKFNIKNMTEKALEVYYKAISNFR